MKRNTKILQAISAGERLCVTLWFLATGDSYHPLMYLFCILVCTIARIIPECCKPLFKTLKDTYLKVPKTPDGWKKHPKLFEDYWNFSQCVGALDSKHIAMQAPPNSGSYYYNYKGFNSIVLTALVDATYQFIYVVIGCNGRVSDGGVFNNCTLSNALSSNSLSLPDAQPLPGRSKPVPFVIVADDAIALKPYLLKPYPFRGQPVLNRIFNYRLSRARRIVVNAFGLIANKFRILRKSMDFSAEKTTVIVSAIWVLHNFFITRGNGYALPGTFDSDEKPGEWRVVGMPTSNLLEVPRGQAHNYTEAAKDVRDEFKDYFVSAHGEIHWQYNHI